MQESVRHIASPRSIQNLSVIHAQVIFGNLVGCKPSGAEIQRLRRTKAQVDAEIRQGVHGHGLDKDEKTALAAMLIEERVIAKESQARLRQLSGTCTVNLGGARSGAGRRRRQPACQPDGPDQLQASRLSCGVCVTVLDLPPRDLALVSKWICHKFIILHANGMDMHRR